MSKFRKKIREIVLYGLIGLFSALIDTGAFIGMVSVELNQFIANLISVNIGILCSFLLNTFINFKKKDALLKRALFFWIVGYIGLLLSMGILYLGILVFHIDEIVVKIISVGFVALVQYLINSNFTFSNKI